MFVLKVLRESCWSLYHVDVYVHHSIQNMSCVQVGLQVYASTVALELVEIETDLSASV